MARRDIVGCRLLLNGGVIASAARPDAHLPEPAGEGPTTEPEPSPSERWAAVLTERRAADLLEAASRRLEEVATREREVVMGSAMSDRGRDA